MARDDRTLIERLLDGPLPPRPPKRKKLDQILDTLDRVTNGLIGRTVVDGVRAMEKAKSPRGR